MSLIWLIFLAGIFFPWIFFCLVALAGILTYLKGENKFNANFYEKINDTQLEKEILKAFNNTLNLFDKNRGYIYTHYKTYEHLVSKIDIYKTQLKSNNIGELPLFKMYFTLKDPFISLSRKNNFPKKQRNIINELYLMLLEFEKRQDEIPR